MPFEKDSHCSYCGAGLPADQAWPRVCVRCGHTSYRNPLPVAVVLLPVDDGLLVIRRSVAPGKGKLALPGGYINLGETWQEAAVRELHEEAGIVVPAREVREFRVRSASDSFLMVFGLVPARSHTDLPEFTATDETSESLILRGPSELAFTTHTEIVREYFGLRTHGRSDPWASNAT